MGGLDVGGVALRRPRAQKVRGSALLRLGRAMWFRWGSNLRREMLQAKGKLCKARVRT